MFYNILDTFAQYLREQLSENVRMGNDPVPPNLCLC